MGKTGSRKRCIVSGDASFRRVAAPAKLDETTFSVGGWKLFLSPGWVVKE